MPNRHVMLIQQGARRDYIYARQLEEAGLLHSLVCDAAWAEGTGQSLSRIAKRLAPSLAGPIERRTVHGVERQRIRSSIIPNAAAVIKLLTDRERAFDLIDEALALRLRARGLNGAKIIVNYLGNGGSFLDYAKRRGARIVTDFISNPAYWEVVQAEQARWPGWEPPTPIASNRDTYEKRIARLVGISDVYLCPSRTVAQNLALVPGFDAARVRVVPYGYSGVKPLPSRPRRGRVLLAGSAVSVAKGLPYLAEAARSLKARRLKVEFVVAGEVAHSARIRPETRDLVFLGILDRKRMAEEFASADIYCLPSLAEGSATSVFEAMANGLPIVTTASSGSMVKNDVEGFIIPERSGAAIARSIERLVTDRELRRGMSSAACAAADRYSAKACGEAFLSVIRELL